MYVSQNNGNQLPPERALHLGFRVTASPADSPTRTLAASISPRALVRV